jgi:hypothetical protein
MKKLIQFNVREDFGTDAYIQIINVRNWSLLQISISWNDYVGWPYCQITMGSNGLFGLLFWAYKLGFDVSLLSRTWRWDRFNENEKYDELPN